MGSKTFTYDSLEMKYGPSVAEWLLREIETAAHIVSAEVMGIDAETRLAHAFQVQDRFLSSQNALAA